MNKKVTHTPRLNFKKIYKENDKELESLTKECVLQVTFGVPGKNFPSFTRKVYREKGMI